MVFLANLIPSHLRIRRRLTELEQWAAIGVTYPGWVRARKGVYIGPLVPGEGSPSYTVKVVYDGHWPPQVWLISPEPLASCPHRYADRSMCLYKPGNIVWQRDAVIAQTIIPLAWTWVGNYELWLETDEWLGPAAPHDDTEEKVPEQ